MLGCFEEVDDVIPAPFLTQFRTANFAARAAFGICQKPLAGRTNTGVRFRGLEHDFCKEI